MTDEELRDFSLDELLDFIEYKDKRHGKISLKRLFQRLKFLLDPIDNIYNIPEKILIKYFEYLVNSFSKMEAIKLLDSISDITLKEKIITHSFEILVSKFTSNQVFEILDSISNKEIKEKLIIKHFKDLVSFFDKNKVLKFLDSISNKEMKEDVVANYFIIIINNFDENRVIEILNSLAKKGLKEKVIEKYFGSLVSKLGQKNIFELLNSIPNTSVKEEMIVKYFGQIAVKVQRRKYFELLNFISNKALRYEIIFKFNKLLSENLNQRITSISFMLNFFDIIFYNYKDRYEPFKVLQQFSKKESDKIIINNAPQLIEIYLQNHKIKNKIFEIIGIVNDKKIKNQLIIDYFDKFFKVNSYKAIRNLNYLKQEEQDNIIVHYFPKLLKNKAFIELLKRVKNRQKKEEIIAKYFEQILQVNAKLAFKLLEDISNKNLIDNTIEKFFPLFLQRHHQYIINLLNLIKNNGLKEKLLIESCEQLAKNRDIEILLKLLNYIEKSQLKEQIFQESMDILAQQKEIEIIRKIVNQTLISAILQEKIKKRYSYLIKEKMNKYIDSLNDIQSTLNSEIKESVILYAYTVIQNQESSREEIDLQKATPEVLSHLIISETKKEKHRELFLYLVERLKEDKSKDYSKIVYKTISRSRIFELYLFELEDFVTTIYFKEELKNFREQKETEQSINKMLGKVLKNPKTNREEIFMKRFKRLRKIKDLYVIVPHVAKRDFDLAQAIMEKRIERKKVQQVQKSIFVNEYQKRWDRAVMAYDKIDDFYIKVDLSKTVLDSFVPDFNSSFFIQAMMILDSQNISKTPMELVTIAPKEVLKYYGEIEDEVEKAFDEVLEQIKVLQGRAIKAEELNDEQGFEEILEEEKKLKISIRADEKLFELFLEKYNLNNLKFMRLNLLDFEV